MDIEVQRMYRFDTDRPLKAFADIIVNDCLLIKGIRVLDGRSGLFVSMPREQARDRKWYDTIRCLTQEIRDDITNVVLDAYNEVEPTDEKDPPEPETPKSLGEQLRRKYNDDKTV